MRYIALWITLAILVFVSSGCDRAAPDKVKNINAVSVVLRPAIARPVQRSVDVVGTLFGDEDATISAKVSGRIASIAHDMGDRCRAGDLLLQIDRTDYELAHHQKEMAVREVLAKLGLEYIPPGEFDPTSVPTVAQMRLKAANAEAKYNRGRQLHEQSPPLMSDQDFADLKTAYEVAKADFDVAMLTARSLLNEARSLQAQAEMARQTLTDTTILAPNPSAGPGGATTQPDDTYAVASRMVSVGEYVREGTPLFRLIDDDPIKLRAAVPERFAADVKIEQVVKVRVEAYADEFTGKVTRINPQIDPANRTFTIEILIPNESHRLKPGAFARARIHTHVDRDVVFVPRDAVVNFAGVNKVFTVGADGNAIEHRVELDDGPDDLVEIVKGLGDSESVVVEGAGKLATGVATQVRPAKPAATTEKSSP